MNAHTMPPDVERCEVRLRTRPLAPLKLVIVLTAAVSFFAGGVFTYCTTPALRVQCPTYHYAEVP